MPEVLTRVDDPDLPDDWGLMQAICADGEHRYLPDAPRCGCGAELNRTVEHQRLKDAVCESAKRQHKSIVGAKKELARSVTALIEFEKRARAE